MEPLGTASVQLLHLLNDTSLVFLFQKQPPRLISAGVLQNVSTYVSGSCFMCTLSLTDGANLKVMVRESQRLLQCLGGADVLCWTQTGGAVCPPLGLLYLLLPVCDTVSVTLITLIVSGSVTVNRPFLWKHLQKHLACFPSILPFSEKHTETPTHTFKHSKQTGRLHPALHPL